MFRSCDGMDTYESVLRSSGPSQPDPASIITLNLKAEAPDKATDATPTQTSPSIKNVQIKSETCFSVKEILQESCVQF